MARGTWQRIGCVLILLASSVPAFGSTWPEQDRARVLRSCQGVDGSSVDVCACALKYLMKEWPTSTEFWKALETPRGKVGVVFYMRECRHTAQVRLAAHAHSKNALGEGWSVLDGRDQARLKTLLDYTVDAAFVRNTSGRLPAPAVLSLRVPNEIVARKSFVESMSRLDPGKFCADGRRSAVEARGAFNNETLTYWCESVEEVPSLGRVRSVYVWQFSESRVVILDALVLPHDNASVVGEVKLALRRTASALSQKAPAP